MNNNLKAIVRHFANLKFWFAAWNKEKDAATAGQIKHSIRTIKRIPIARKLLMMQRTSMVCVYRSDEKSSVPIMPLGYEFTRGHYMSQGAFLCNEYRTFSYRNISGPSGCDIDFTYNKEE
jgi:hypothetical protein